MKFYILSLFLFGCSANSGHNWVVVDYSNNECMYLENSKIYIEDKIVWSNFDGKFVSTSKDFNLQKVRNQEFAQAAQNLGFDSQYCINGFNK